MNIIPSIWGLCKLMRCESIHILAMKATVQKDSSFHCVEQRLAFNVQYVATSVLPPILLDIN